MTGDPALMASTNPARFTAHGVLRLNCPAASTTVPAMKKSIILVSALSVVVMALVSCATDSDVDPARVRFDTTTPTQEAAPAHRSHISGM
jgi:hypothetical protein